MRIKSLLLLLILSNLAVICDLKAQSRYVSDKITKYVDFIDGCNTSAVDYVMSLFDKYDVVILGERDHRDTTQYDLIEQIISDPRFIDKVGHVMTEVGVYNMTREINQVVNASYKSDREFESALWEVYKNLDYMPLWENTNFHQYLYSVYRVNRHLSESKKIRITLTDVPFSWRQTDNLTHDQFQDFLEVWQQKDIIMANNVMTELYELFDGTEQRKKALIIFNAPHSFATVGSKRIYKKNNTTAGQLIMDRFPERVANVVINWAKRQNGYRGLVQNGRWDAAFAACGNKSVGFDFSSSPFGDDRFDIRPDYFRNQPKYKDVYTGFIFYKPVDEWIFGIGVPNSTDSCFQNELIRRDCNIWDGEPLNESENKAEVSDYYTKIRTFRLTDTEHSFTKTANQQINRYYRP